MLKTSKNKITAIFAVLFVLIAVGLLAMLLLDDGENKNENAGEGITVAPTQPDSGLVAVVESKYLWQYGSQQVASEKPSEVPTTENADDAEDNRADEPQTYYEQITNWRGENVTDEDGNAVTEIHTHPRTEVYTENVTDANGEPVTDENGEPVTELHSQVVSTTNPPVYVTDANGEAVTDENGEPETEEEKTTAVVGSSVNTGSKQWAQGVSDGEKYVSMNIYIDGDYNVKNTSVMKLTLREESGLISLPDSLVYNLSKGTCTVGTRKYNQSAYITKKDGQTVVTLIIPENAQPNVSDTTAFRASSTLSTFMDAKTGNYLEEFEVSVK